MMKTSEKMMINIALIAFTLAVGSGTVLCIRRTATIIQHAGVFIQFNSARTKTKERISHIQWLEKCCSAWAKVEASPSLKVWTKVEN